MNNNNRVATPSNLDVEDCARGLCLNCGRGYAVAVHVLDNPMNYEVACPRCHKNLHMPSSAIEIPKARPRHKLSSGVLQSIFGGTRKLAAN